jgi:hypothetical protein
MSSGGPSHQQWGGSFQIPPDFVVKTQAIDIVKVIL